MTPNDAMNRLAIVPAIATSELPHDRVSVKTADGFEAVMVFDPHSNRWRFQPGTGRPIELCHFHLRRLIVDALNPQAVNA